MDDILIRDTVFNPNQKDKTIHYYKDGDGRIRYKVFIYVTGIKTYLVDYVVYNLHSSFKNPIRRKSRDLANPNCILELWVWGSFIVNATIFLKSGTVFQSSHQLTFDKDFFDPERKLQRANLNEVYGTGNDGV